MKFQHRYKSDLLFNKTKCQERNLFRSGIRIISKICLSPDIINEKK